MTTTTVTNKPAASHLRVAVDNGKHFVKPYYSSNFRLRKKLTVHTNLDWKSPEQKAAMEFAAFLEGRHAEEMTRNFGESEANIHIEKMPIERIVKLTTQILRDRKFSVTVVYLKQVGTSARISMRRHRS